MRRSSSSSLAFARFQGSEAGVPDDVGPVQDHAEAGPFLVGEDGDGAPGVAAEAGVGVVGGGSRVTVAVTNHFVTVEYVVHLHGGDELQAALQL